MDTYASSGKDVKMVHVHGWVYELETGRLRDLGISCGPEELVGHKHDERGPLAGVQEDVQAGVQAQQQQVQAQGQTGVGAAF